MAGRSYVADIRSVHLVGKDVVDRGVLLEVPLEVPEGVRVSCLHVGPSEGASGQGKGLVPGDRLLKVRSGALQ